MVIVADLDIQCDGRHTCGVKVCRLGVFVGWVAGFRALGGSLFAPLVRFAAT